MNAIHAATQECFGAIGQLRRCPPESAPSPALLHRRLKGFVDAMRERLKREGHGHEDIQDITYAIAALADEVALGLGDPVATYWVGNLLQYHYFRENTAGEGFFVRLQSARRDGSRSRVLWVYTMCLYLGFQGKYRVRGGEVELLNLLEELQRELGAPPTETETLGPSAERPTEALTHARGTVPLLLASAGFLVAALLLFLGLRWSLSSEVDALRSVVTQPRKP